MNISQIMFYLGCFLIIITMVLHIFVVNNKFSWTEDESYMLKRGYIGGFGLILLSLF